MSYGERGALRSRRLCRNVDQSQSRRGPPETCAPPSSFSLLSSTPTMEEWN